MLSMVSGGSGSPDSFTPARPAVRISQSNGAWSVSRMEVAASMISGPMPSPGIKVAGMRVVIPDITQFLQLIVDVNFSDHFYRFAIEKGWVVLPSGNCLPCGFKKYESSLEKLQRNDLPILPNQNLQSNRALDSLGS